MLLIIWKACKKGIEGLEKKRKRYPESPLVSSPPSVGELLDVSGTPRPNRNRAVSPMPRTLSNFRK